MIVLDTNVTSELMRSSPSALVMAWLQAQNPRELYSTAVSVAEIRYGIVRERAGTPINGFDAQIASICRANQALLVTRNVKDFENTGIGVTNPWADGVTNEP